MEINDALDIMNSDFKLWEQAKTEDLGNGRVSKTITLPWGIGDYVVQLEGMNDAGKRRDAVSAYGEHIRSVIDDRINDDAITSRAEINAARTQQSNSEDSGSVSGELGVHDKEVQEEDVESPEQAHKRHATRPVGLREVLTARRTEINDDIEYFTARLESAIKELDTLVNKELVAVEAGLEALGDE